MRGIQVRIHIEYLHLESYHDVLRVFDGCCEDEENMYREFTGMFVRVLLQQPLLSKVRSRDSPAVKSPSAIN